MEITSSRISVYEVVVDLNAWDDRPSNQVPGFADDLIQFMPSLKSHKCLSGQVGGFHSELTRGTNFGHVIEHVLLELIRLLKSNGEKYSGWTRSRGNGEYVIHYGAPDFLTGRLAAIFAVEIVQQLQRGSLPDLDTYLISLQNPIEYFSREGWNEGTPPASGNSQLIQAMEYADPAQHRESSPKLSDWQRRNLVHMMGQVCSELPGVKERWQKAFIAFGGEFAQGILDKVELLNPDYFSRKLLVGHLDAYFTGVANLSHMIRSLGIPRNFVTHSAWLYKNFLLLAILEKSGRDKDAWTAAVEDLDDFYQNVLSSIQEGYSRTDLVSAKVDEMKLCGFQARHVRRGTVLVVDDDTMARQVARDILEYHGILTLGARDGIEALGAMAENRAEVRVVLLDLILPGIDGMAVCRRILDGYPKARIILSSGYPMDERTGQCLTDHEVCFLRKPYRSEELITTVQDLLDLRTVAAHP